MTHLLLLAMWTAAISGWYSALYFYRTANSGQRPDTGVILKTLAVSAVSLFIGTMMYSFVQSTMVTYVMKGGGF